MPNFGPWSALPEEVPRDTIVEDFVMTMRIAQKGYRVAYEPGAYAVENASASVKEELKRKIRIAAGGLQACVRLASLLNPFRYGVLSFQYISHRVLRWTFAPLALPILFLLNFRLARSGDTFYELLFIVQILFYIFALIGYFLAKYRIKNKFFFVPYYFCVMNYAMYAGFLRLVRGRQSVLWERSKRAI
jgi:poly-beta-1,6-N-acetyl-D-glucosamine synthase